ncbi:carbohydrate ABC transporter substrate-binding protein [Lactonifactor longoviformis]|uniref:Carbohydrate ABC transporter substrate-binding protein, CUT1 family (TC 3.A.1.1.-) n=1 Tax=Lactonifactor longoviformis DSM 17459 TaxID=1122155 RepID=A0A1M5A025_9CLOT|nr:carbohydrate ABC transporter substrate-binding protein [Lactonifactor longoviformis]POP31130.1 carbohydrate ABC transporter substrate-binding protein [Lactonifactor longoviformis]SHF23660.1 carbohydrate ABC transporter substrate-binding protein, CUT1 family (TC 3.A.1.1.-) [Lactonifactor longoviformis DSM 17459]
MKRKEVTRWLALGLAAVMSTTILAGCGNTDDSSKGGDDAKGDGGQVLKVAAFEGGYGAELWSEVAKAFEETHEGVTVELQVDKKIEDKITPAMKSGDYPDVIHCATGRDAGLTETITKEKGLTCLDDVLDMTVPGEEVTVREKILPGFLDTLGTMPYNDGKTYYAPMFYSPCGLFYNAGLLKEKGWEVPKTWDEMWELGDKAKAEGISLFTYPHAGYFDAFIYATLESSGGAEFYNECMTYKDGIWESPEATAVFETIGKLAQYVEPTTLGNANEESFTKNQQLILDNKAIFCPNGTWLPGEMADAPRAEGFEWGFTAVPAVSDSQKPSSFTFFEQMWIPAEGKNQDLAKEWIAFMYSDKAADIFAKSNAIQPIVGISEKLTGDNKMFYSVYDNDAAVPVMGGFASTNPVEGVSMNDTLFRAVDSIVSGDKTVADWQKSVEEASDKLREAME